jgi:hypothetical protein
MHPTLASCRPCRDEREQLEVLRPFRGKQLQGVLMGDHITDNASERRALLRQARSENFQIYTMSGDTYSPADMCDV